MARACGGVGDSNQLSMVCTKREPAASSQTTRTKSGAPRVCSRVLAPALALFFENVCRDWPSRTVAVTRHTLWTMQLGVVVSLLVFSGERRLAIASWLAVMLPIALVALICVIATPPACALAANWLSQQSGLDVRNRDPSQTLPTLMICSTSETLFPISTVLSRAAFPRFRCAASGYGLSCR